MSLKTLLTRLWRNQSGATALEYGLMLSLIVLTMFGALAAMGNEIEQTWNNVSSQSNSATAQAAA